MLVLTFILFYISFIYSLGSKVKLSWKLTSITKSDGKGYVLVYETPEGVVSVQAKSVIMTIPSYVASDILRPLSVSNNLSSFMFPETGVLCFLIEKIVGSYDLFPYYNSDGSNL